MKQYYLIFFTIFMLGLICSCSRKATPEQIEEYETIKKINEVREKYGYPESTAEKNRKMFDSSCQFDYSYLMKHKDEIYTMDVETGKIKVEYDRTIKEESEVGKILKALSTEHFNNHKDLVPGTSEWDLWMHNAMGAYIINEKGKYKKKNRIYVRENMCPFCRYKDRKYFLTGEIKEANYWGELALLENNSVILNFRDEKMKDEEFLKKQRDFFIDNCFTNLNNTSLTRLINQSWNELYPNNKVATSLEKKEFKKVWECATIKYTGIIEDIRKGSIDWTVKISGKDCQFGMEGERVYNTETIYNYSDEKKFYDYKITYNEYDTGEELKSYSDYPEGICVKNDVYNKVF